MLSKYPIWLLTFLLIVACGSDVIDSLPTVTPKPTQEMAIEPTATQTPTAVLPTNTPSPTTPPEPVITPTPSIITQLSNLQEPTLQRVSWPSNFAEPYLPESNANIGRDVAVYNGRLWFASIAGLIAIHTDSDEATPYTTANGLLDNTVYAIETCDTGQLFVGSGQGLSIYNTEADQFESVEVYPESIKIEDMVCENGRLTIATNEATTILNLSTNERTDHNQPTQHILWAGQDIWIETASNGLLRIYKDGTTEVYSEANGNLPDDSITSITQAPDGTYWFAGQYGFWHYTNGEWQAFDAENRPEVISYWGPKQIQSLSDGSLWLTFSERFCLFDPQQQTCQIQFAYQDLGLVDGGNIDEVIFSDQSPIAFSTHYHGIGYFTGDSWKRYQLTESISSQYMSQIFQDSQGIIWAVGGDVYRLLTNGWEQVDGLYAEHMATTSNDILWFGGGHYSLHSYNQGAVTNHSLTLYYTSLAVTTDEVVYAGSFDGYTILDRNSLNIVTNVTVDSHGWDMGSIQEMLYANETVYAITEQGLVTLQGESWQVLVDDPTLTAIASKADGTILLGSEIGLYTYQDGSFIPDNQVIEPVKTIFATDNGQIWVATATSDTFAGTNFSDEGYLHWLDGTQWQVRSLSDGFPINGLRALYVDNTNTVWIGFDGGILHLDPQ